MPAILPEPFPHLIPPDGCVSLVASLNEVIPFRQIELSGAGFGMQRVDIPPGTTFIGARFQPGAYGCFFQIPIHEVVNRFVDVGHLPGLSALLDAIQAESTDFRALEDALRGMPCRRQPDTLVQASADTLVRSLGNAPIGAMAHRMGVQPRTLQRRFLKETGVTMKEFARLYRMRTALIAMLKQEFNLTHSALEAGYSDQSHFIREAIRLSQENPGKLRARYRQIRMEGLVW